MQSAIKRDPYTLWSCNATNFRKYALVIDLLTLINNYSCVYLVNGMEGNNTVKRSNTTANLIWQRSKFTITYLLHNTSSNIADDIMAPPFQSHNNGGGKGGGWQVSVPSWNGQSETFAQYEEVTLLNYVTAQSGQRRVLGGQLIQNIPDKSQQQLFAMRLSRVDPEVVATRIKRRKEK